MNKSRAGFALIEIVLVVVLLGILSVYALPKLVAASGQSSLKSQAHKLAQDIRHAQMLAITWERPLRFIANNPNGTYSVACISVGSAPCDRTVTIASVVYPLPVLDPSTGSPFTVTLRNRVVLAGTGTLDFDTRGMPSTSASYSLTASPSVQTISLQPLGGFVTVTP